MTVTMPSSGFSVGTASSFTVTTHGFPISSVSESGALPTGGNFAAGSGAISQAGNALTVNQASHEYKEEIKVGYNLRRKVVLLTIWALSPLPLYFDPTFFGVFTPAAGKVDFIRHVAESTQAS